MIRQPVDLPPIISVELIQITDKTNIPYAPKARKVIEKVKKEEKRVVSEQAPPAAKAKEKPDRIPLPKKQDEKKRISAYPLRIERAFETARHRFAAPRFSERPACRRPGAFRRTGTAS